MALTHLDEGRAAAVEALCEALVPGSERIGPSVYIDGLLRRMPDGDRAYTLSAIDVLADALGEEDGLAARQSTPEFGLLRALAIEAYYSDFVAPGKPGPGAWTEIDFHTPLAMRLDKDWSYLIGEQA